MCRRFLTFLGFFSEGCPGPFFTLPSSLIIFVCWLGLAWGTSVSLSGLNHFLLSFMFRVPPPLVRFGSHAARRRFFSSRPLDPCTGLCPPFIDMLLTQGLSFSLPLVPVPPS